MMQGFSIKTQTMKKVVSLEHGIQLSNLNLPIKNEYHYLVYLQEGGTYFDRKQGMPSVPAYTEDELLEYIPKVLYVPYLNQKEQVVTWELKVRNFLVGDTLKYNLFYSRPNYSPIFDVYGQTLIDALVNLILLISKEYDSEGKYKL